MAEIFIITDMGSLQHFQMWVIFAGAIPFNDFMSDSIDKGVEVLNLHGGNPIHINLNVRKKLDKVLMGGKFAEQTVVDPTVFQKCYHLIIQMQLRQWRVDLLPVLCPAQQIINGNPIEVCQRDEVAMDSLNVSAGQSVKKGDNIGKSGNTGSSTGSHLHIECLYNGEYYNSLFYFEAGEQTIYGETTGGTGGGTSNVIPPESYDDATVQTLMREANRYLGMPYTFGGTAPASFDCSGFVCWVFSNSGVHNLPRTTAQGIYDQCTPVSAADAKAGDIIFFTGTYNAGRPVTHVGIYCGNGTMVHCGDPIQYTSINTSYWQSHFYGFGRLN